MRRSRIPALLVLPAIVVAGITVPFAANAIGVIDTITVGNGPEGIAVSADGATVYVTNRDDDTVSRIDVATGTVTGTVTVGDEPIGMFSRPGTAELWVTNIEGDSISVVDTTTFTVSTTFSSGLNGPWGVVFDSSGEIAYVSVYSGDSIVALTADTGAVVDSASGFSYPQGLALTADGAWLYAAATNGDAVAKVDTATLEDVSFIPVGDFPVELRWAPNGTLWVSNNGQGTNDTISVIDPDTDTVVDTIPVDPYPRGFAFTADGSAAWVSSAAMEGGIAKFDVATGDRLGGVETGFQSTDVVLNPVSGQFYVTNSNSNSVSVIGIDTDRLAGADRFETSVRISEAAFQSGADVVYVATGLNYPDALAAGPAAGVEGGPILLVAPTFLPDSVRAEIDRLNPNEIIVLGATPSVSAAVYGELSAIAPTRRIQGDDRYKTARAIIRDSFTTAPRVYLSTGQNFPDALGAGNAGAAFGIPVVLVNGDLSTVDAATLDLLDDLGTTDITILGGPTTVNPGIQTQLSGLGFTVNRLAGANRFETSVLINQDAFTGTSEYAILATGLKFPDALAGSSIGAKTTAPLYAIPSDCVPPAVLDEFDRLSVSFVVLLGGPTTLATAVESLTPCP